MESRRTNSRASRRWIFTVRAIPRAPRHNAERIGDRGCGQTGRPTRGNRSRRRISQRSRQALLSQRRATEARRPHQLVLDRRRDPRAQQHDRPRPRQKIRGARRHSRAVRRNFQISRPDLDASGRFGSGAARARCSARCRGNGQSLLCRSRQEISRRVGNARRQQNRVQCKSLAGAGEHVPRLRELLRQPRYLVPHSIGKKLADRRADADGEAKQRGGGAAALPRRRRQPDRLPAATCARDCNRRGHREAASVSRHHHPPHTQLRCQRHRAAGSHRRGRALYAYQAATQRRDDDGRALSRPAARGAGSADWRNAGHGHYHQHLGEFWDLRYDGGESAGSGSATSPEPALWCAGVHQR
jgi:hypothetical protein